MEHRRLWPWRWSVGVGGTQSRTPGPGGLQDGRSGLDSSDLRLRLLSLQRRDWPGLFDHRRDGPGRFLIGFRGDRPLLNWRDRSGMLSVIWRYGSGLLSFYRRDRSGRFSVIWRDRSVNWRYGSGLFSVNWRDRSGLFYVNWRNGSCCVLFDHRRDWPCKFFIVYWRDRSGLLSDVHRRDGARWSFLIRVCLVDDRPGRGDGVGVVGGVQHSLTGDFTSLLGNCVDVRLGGFTSLALWRLPVMALNICNLQRKSVNK